jgi:hypothetical protein
VADGWSLDSLANVLDAVLRAEHVGITVVAE